MAPRQRARKGEGTLYFETARNRWVGQLDLGVVNGKRRRVTVTGATEAAARAALEKKLADAGLGVDPGLAGQPLKDVLVYWRDEVLPTRWTNPNTVKKYRRSIDKHLIPNLGTKRLDALSIADVEKMLKGIGGARATLVTHRQTLSFVLRWAQRRGYVARDVADLADIPTSAAPTQGRALDPDETRALMAAALTGKTLEPSDWSTARFDGTWLGTMWLVQLSLALRPGEVNGLLWEDVDFDEHHIRIRRSMKYDDDNPIGLGEVKTGNQGRGRRTLKMPMQVEEALSAHRARMDEARSAMGPRWPEKWEAPLGVVDLTELVFLSTAGTPLRPANMRRSLRAAAKRAKIEGSLDRYDLRHTAATLLSDMDVPIEDIADILGHSSLRMAREIYTKAKSKPLGAGVEPMDKVLNDEDSDDPS